MLYEVITGEMKPFSKYTIHVKAIGTSGESAEGYAEFETGRLDRNNFV